MAIAVVFLIMFIFSMLASGIKSTQTAIEKTEENAYRLGQIPQAVRKQNKTDIKKFDQSIEAIKSNQTIVQQSLKAMQTLSKEMESSKESFKRTKEDLLQKTSRLDQASKKIKNQDAKITDLNHKVGTLAKKNQQKQELNQEITKNLNQALQKTKDQAVKIKSLQQQQEKRTSRRRWP